MQDRLEIKKTVKEKELIIEELVKSNADLKQFSYITSHNLRAPLSNIEAILSHINYSTLDSGNAEMLKMLQTSEKQLAKTIDIDGHGLGLYIVKQSDIDSVGKEIN